MQRRVAHCAGSSPLPYRPFGPRDADDRQVHGAILQGSGHLSAVCSISDPYRQCLDRVLFQDLQIRLAPLPGYLQLSSSGGVDRKFKGHNDCGGWEIATYNPSSYRVTIKDFDRVVYSDLNADGMNASKLIDATISRELVEKGSKIGVRIISSFYTNGVFDWVIIFTADNVKGAKRFVENLHITFEGHVQEIQLLETMFALQKGGIENPQKEKLREFFADAI